MSCNSIWQTSGSKSTHCYQCQTRSVLHRGIRVRADSSRSCIDCHPWLLIDRLPQRKLCRRCAWSTCSLVGRARAHDKCSAAPLLLLEVAYPSIYVMSGPLAALKILLYSIYIQSYSTLFVVDLSADATCDNRHCDALLFPKTVEIEKACE